MTLGERLREARTYLDLTQMEVSKRSGVNNKTLSNWENDVSRPSTDDLLLLSEIYNISIDKLLGNPHRPARIFEKLDVSSDMGRAVLEAHKREEAKKEALYSNYCMAPKEIQAAVDAVLAPYMPKEKEKGA